ncbi:POL1 protein, partial [Ciccaba nigrolineata]|nr:POL1 protein [Ciccaba nigrolineata]
IVEGNHKADQAARGVWSLDAAKSLHAFLHLGAKALAKTCHISLSQAKNIVALCPYCQKGPLWEAGVNPRGLSSNQIWQTDVTTCELLKPNKYLIVTIDTFSSTILATMA